MVKNFILVFFSTLLLNSLAHAAFYKNINYRFEPFVGYEQVYRTVQSAHTASRMVYGLRLLVGVEKFSAEGEYLTGQDTETFSSAPQSVTYKNDKFKAGIRSTFRTKSIFYYTLQLGAQIDSLTKDSKSNGVTTSTSTTQTDPYAGVILGIAFTKDFTLGVGSTVVFKDFGDFTKCDFQNSLIIGIGF